MDKYFPHARLAMKKTPYALGMLIHNRLAAI